MLGIGDLHVELLNAYEFPENWHMDGRTFLWAKMKLLLPAKLTLKWYDTLKGENALVKSA